MFQLLKKKTRFKIKCFPLGSQWNKRKRCVSTWSAQAYTQSALRKGKEKNRTEYCSVEKCYSKYDYLKTEQPEF